MKVVFMGTPDFAVPTLEKIVKSHHQVIGVVTRPDRPRGRGKKVTPSPVKSKALEYNLPVLQPEKVKNNREFLDKLISLNPDIIVVVAFGQILPKEILELPPYGCVNVHASLLPRYRGAAPIHWAVINGDKETGVTTMYMSEGLDTGDMIYKEVLAIHENATTGEVHDKLAEMGADLLLRTLESIEAGTAPRIPQDDSRSSYAPMLTKELELIDWGKPAEQIRNLIRGMNPWPGAYTYYNGKILKIWESESIEVIPGKAGEILDILPQKGFIVACGKGALLVTGVQPQGGRRMSASDYVRGSKIQVGEFLNNAGG